MSIVSALQTFVKTYTGIGSTALVTVDKVGNNPGDFSLIAQPGERVLEAYINGGSKRADNRRE